MLYKLQMLYPRLELTVVPIDTQKRSVASNLLNHVCIARHKILRKLSIIVVVQRLLDIFFVVVDLSKEV